MGVHQRVQCCVPEVFQVWIPFMHQRQHHVVEASRGRPGQYEDSEGSYPHLQVLTSICQQRPVQMICLQYNNHLRLNGWISDPREEGGSVTGFPAAGMKQPSSLRTSGVGTMRAEQEEVSGCSRVALPYK
jgi:hypothetical protein